MIDRIPEFTHEPSSIGSRLGKIEGLLEALIVNSKDDFSALNMRFARLEDQVKTDGKQQHAHISQVEKKMEARMRPIEDLRVKVGGALWAVASLSAFLGALLVGASKAIAAFIFHTT